MNVNEANLLGVSQSQDLELPVDPAFVSRPPQVSLARMMAKCREMRAMFPQGVPTHEERLAAKTDVEFIL